MTGPLTKSGVDLFAPTDGNGNARGPDIGDVQRWAAEIEALLGLPSTGVTLAPRVATDSGDVTISTTDRRVHVKKTVEAGTNVNFPSVSDWIAARGYTPFTLKNRMSNPALYPLMPVLSGADTIEDSSAVLPLDTRQEMAFWPDDSVTPHNWEMRPF